MVTCTYLYLTAPQVIINQFVILKYNFSFTFIPVFVIIKQVEWLENAKKSPQKNPFHKIRKSMSYNVQMINNFQ